ncbi:unnamed protein product [Mytilus edulis]|uniref:Uncharacterized protein n=1 Tax=Mytilus edulis TaxID=6550 RepID=A0A8S3RP97_MYTED|nr:unnamed protein product [Mytilus edulis]
MPTNSFEIDESVDESMTVTSTPVSTNLLQKKPECTRKRTFEEGGKINNNKLLRYSWKKSNPAGLEFLENRADAPDFSRAQDFKLNVYKEGIERGLWLEANNTFMRHHIIMLQIKHLSTSGGDTVKQSVRRIMGTILENCIAMKLNWLGRGDKTVFPQCKHLLSAISQPVNSLIDTEIQKGYLFGPFDNIPYKHFRINPIEVAEGKYSKKKRLIVDLSAPHDDELNPSLNELIDTDPHQSKEESENDRTRKMKHQAITETEGDMKEKEPEKPEVTNASVTLEAVTLEIQPENMEYIPDDAAESRNKYRPKATRILAQTTNNPDDLTVLITAPTGSAAFKIHGLTIHSALGIFKTLSPDHATLSEDNINYTQNKVGKFANLDY